MTRKIVTSCLLFIIILGLLPVQAAAKKKTEKKKKAPTVKVAVVDVDKKRAKGMIRWAESCGMKAELVSSSSVDPNRYDGLLVPGGGDVDPKLYGAKRNKHTYGTSYRRSRLQIDVILKFAEAKKPILGICGGCQTINVAFGGTLKQHIGWHFGWHRIRIKKGSWLYRTYGSRPKVYHFHHQCVARLGDGIIATMRARDNHQIEGIQHKTLPIYGIQWHPDQMGKKGRKVGRKFISTCLAYAKKKNNQ